MRGLHLDLSWERRSDYHHVGSAEIGRMLQPAFPGASVAHAELLAAGKCNSNYKVAVAGRAEPVIVRVYGRDPSAGPREAALYRRLGGRVPMAAVLYSGQPPGADALPYSILTWVDGVLLADWLPGADEDDACAVTRRLGGILAVLFAEHFDHAGFFGQDLSIEHAFDNVVDAYLAHMEDNLFRQPAGAVLGAELAKRLWAHVQANRALLDAVKTHTHLSHCDFGPWNLMVRETRSGPEVAAVLDWEFASSGSFLADAGNLFRHRALMPARRLSALAEGLTEGGAVMPPEWAQIARLLDLVALSGMAALGADRPALAADVACLMAESLQASDEE